jgi:hypothetical protein
MHVIVHAALGVCAYACACDMCDAVHSRGVKILSKAAVVVRVAGQVVLGTCMHGKRLLHSCSNPKACGPAAVLFACAGCAWALAAADQCGWPCVCTDGCQQLLHTLDRVARYGPCVVYLVALHCTVQYLASMGFKCACVSHMMSVVWSWYVLHACKHACTHVSALGSGGLARCGAEIVACTGIALLTACPEAAAQAS